MIRSKRPWYQTALHSAGVVLSEPYILSFASGAGITASTVLPGGRAVLGVDMTLGDLQGFIEGQDVSPHGGVLLVDSKKTIMAKTAGFERRPGWLVKSVVRRLAGQDLEIILTAPPEDFDGEFRMMELSVVTATVPSPLPPPSPDLDFQAASRKIISDLSLDVDRVCRMTSRASRPRGRASRNSTSWPADSRPLKSTLSGETRVLADAQLKLKKIVETGIALSPRKTRTPCARKSSTPRKSSPTADGGTLYLLNDKERFLDFNNHAQRHPGHTLRRHRPSPFPPG